MRILRVSAITVAAGVLACVTGTSTAAAQSTCVDLGGTVGQDQICTVHTSNPTYTLDMTFPNDYPDQQALMAYLTQARDGFVNVSEMPGSYNLPYELDAKGTGYHTDTPSGGTRSVVFTMWQNVGGVHPQTWYKSFNWDIGKKAPITFDTLFKPGTDPLAVLNPMVRQKFGGHHDGPVQDLDATTYRNFAITDDAVIFFFAQDQVVADNNGPHRLSVPRSELAQLLA